MDIFGSFSFIFTLTVFFSSFIRFDARKSAEIILTEPFISLTQHYSSKNTLIVCLVFHIENSFWQKPVGYFTDIY